MRPWLGAGGQERPSGAASDACPPNHHDPWSPNKLDAHNPRKRRWRGARRARSSTSARRARCGTPGRPEGPCCGHWRSERGHSATPGRLALSALHADFLLPSAPRLPLDRRPRRGQFGGRRHRLRRSRRRSRRNAGRRVDGPGRRRLAVRGRGPHRGSLGDLSFAGRAHRALSPARPRGTGGAGSSDQPEPGKVGRAVLWELAG